MRGFGGTASATGAEIGSILGFGFVLADWSADTEASSSSMSTSGVLEAAERSRISDDCLVRDLVRRVDEFVPPKNDGSRLLAVATGLLELSEAFRLRGDELRNFRSAVQECFFHESRGGAVVRWPEADWLAGRGVSELSPEMPRRSISSRSLKVGSFFLPSFC